MSPIAKRVQSDGNYLLTPWKQITNEIITLSVPSYNISRLMFYVTVKPSIDGLVFCCNVEKARVFSVFCKCYVFIFMS